jgi:hypothetical protein
MKCRLAVCLMFASVVGIQGQSPAPLFTPAMQPAAVDAADPHVLRRRWVTIDYERLRDTMPPRAATESARTIAVRSALPILVSRPRTRSGLFTSANCAWRFRQGASGRSPTPSSCRG